MNRCRFPVQQPPQQADSVCAMHKRIQERKQQRRQASAPQQQSERAGQSRAQVYHERGKYEYILYAEKGQKVALSRRMGQRWRLSAFGIVR